MRGSEHAEEAFAWPMNVTSEKDQPVSQPQDQAPRRTP